ncbi:MAG: amidohydrolase [Candidatus Kariarchaeaceae archaeon]|jgi:imidazolonepropionase-like amidohydrolase
MVKAYKGATIIPVDGDVINDGILIIEDDKIVNVGDASLDITNYEVIDCSGKYITPGLIDAHSHVGLWEEGAGAPHSDGNEMSAPITPSLRAIDAIYADDMGYEDARKAGVTCMGITPGSANLIGGLFAVVKSYGSVVDDMIIKEPAGLKMALGENPRRVGRENKRAPHTRMASAQMIRKAFFEAIDYRNKWQDYEENIKIEEKKSEEERKVVTKPEYDMDKEVLIDVLEGSIPIRCHSHRADDIRTIIRIAEEFSLDLVIDHATESHKIAELIAEKELPVVVGPLMTARTKRELRDRTLETPGILMKAGALVCITNDAPVIPIYMLRESMIVAVRAGLPADRAFETITLNPAIVLGIDDLTGSLTKGKDADFVVWDGDPFDARTNALETYIDGILVHTKE